MSPSSFPFRSANVPEIASPASKGTEKVSTSSPLSSPTDILKDTRAYEHGRQRVKRAAELIRAKERKETAAGRNIQGPRVDKPKSSIVRANKKTSWFAGTEVKAFWELDNEKQPEVEHTTMPVNAISETDGFQDEVKLTDLIVSRKPRKIKGGPYGKFLVHIWRLPAFVPHRSGLRSHSSTSTSHRLRRVHGARHGCR